MSNGLQVLNMYGNVGVATKTQLQHLFSHQLYQNNNNKLELFLLLKTSNTTLKVVVVVVS